METHLIVPTEVSEEGGIAKSQTIELCDVCLRDAHSWYRGRAGRSSYNEDTKRFIARSAIEMVREYQTAFNTFGKFQGDTTTTRSPTLGPRGTAPTTGTKSRVTAFSPDPSGVEACLSRTIDCGRRHLTLNFVPQRQA